MAASILTQGLGSFADTRIILTQGLGSASAVANNGNFFLLMG